MYSFFYKKVDSTEAVSNNYISVNNFGYYEDITDIKTYRESGRVDYQLIYVKRGRLIVGKNGNAVLISEDDYRAIEETIYLNNIPGMTESIITGGDTPLSDCVEYDENW